MLEAMLEGTDEEKTDSLPCQTRQEEDTIRESYLVQIVVDNDENGT